MHITEGFLPHPWWEIWWAIALPIVAYGIYKLSKTTKKFPEAKPLLALMGAFIFVISALKLPSLVGGSSSHPTGSGLAAILFGPAASSVLSLVALLFQALLLAHGGVSTLGANLVSMGIIGPLVAFGIWIFFKKARLSNSVGVFTAVALSDLATYVVTAVQLALVPEFQTAAGFYDALFRFLAIYGVTQIPLAIGEGILAIFLFDFLAKYKGSLLAAMKVIKLPNGETAQETEQK